MKTALAVLIAAAMVAPSSAAGEQSTPTPTTGATSQTACVPVKVAYAEKNWRDAKPVDGRTLCPVRRRAGKQNTVEHFYLYRHYRLIAPIHYHGEDKWLRWSPIPAYILDCEGGTWDSHNPSGADGPAQMMDAPDVNARSSARTKVAYWDAVRALWNGGNGASNWVCA